MQNDNEFEKRFFTYLQKQFSRNDLIKLNESYVPNRLSNRVNRFYSSNDSIWFSRLKINDNKKIYYFGEMDDANPKATVTFSTDNKESRLRFTKKEHVYLRVYAKSEVFKKLNKFFTLKYVSKDKSANYYFLDLGKINSAELIKNIELLIRSFDFKTSLKSKYLIVEKFIRLPEPIKVEKTDIKEDYAKVLKTNMNVIEVKNNILKKKLPYNISQELNEFLFEETDGNDYILNREFKSYFDLTDDEIFKSLNKSISKINPNDSYESILQKIIDDIDPSSPIPVGNPQTPPVEDDTVGTDSQSFEPGRDVYRTVKDKFALEKPRHNQLEIISEVVYAINKGFKYIILEAGTGIGKSAVAATLARIYESSYILTVTKQLQNQYYRDFKKFGFSLVKGRQNFSCIRHSSVTCDKGDCVLKNKSCDYNIGSSNPLNELKPACPGYFWKSDTHCPYWTQKVEALNSSVVIANYDFALYDFNLSHYFKKRRLLILDEAHNLENKIMGFISLDLNRKTLKKDIGLDLDYRTIDKLQKGKVSDWINFVMHVKEKYDERAKTLINRAKAKGEDEDFIKDLEKELKIESANRQRFISYISNDKNNWICDYDDRNDIISFKPLSVKNYTNDYLFSFGDVCIFMSATILNHKKFAQWMGVDINDVYSIRIDSPFNSADNPIIMTQSYDMASKNLKSNAPKTIPIINQILAKHKNEKGLIHTVSKDCRRYIMRKIDDDRLMTHTTKDRNKKLEEYKSSKNSVLVSPSMSEGVDLPGDNCRFQIIYKLPLMKLSEQVRKRLDDDEEWYDYRTSISLVQTFGRGIRFDGDYCTTYVVDRRFKDFIIKDKTENHFLPDYVLKAIK